MSILTDAPRPEVSLIGSDGNAFAVIGQCQKAQRKIGWTENKYQPFKKKQCREIMTIC